MLEKKKCNFYHLLASICGLTCFLLSSLDIPKSCERIRLEGSIIRNTKRSKRPIIQLSILVLKSHTKIHTQWHIHTHTHALYNAHTHTHTLSHLHTHSYTYTHIQTHKDRETKHISNGMTHKYIQTESDTHSAHT